MELVCYFIFYQTGNASFASASFCEIFGGVIGGWLSIITSAIDLIMMKDESTRQAGYNSNVPNGLWLIFVRKIQSVNVSERISTLILAQLFLYYSKKSAMNIDPNRRQAKQPEDGNNDDLNLTNSDATLADQTPKLADTSGMSDNATTAASDNLTQSVMNGSEINPEYGDAADPTFETM